MSIESPSAGSGNHQSHPRRGLRKSNQRKNPRTAACCIAPNFQITGFTEQPAIENLVSLARKRNIPLMEIWAAAHY